MLYKIISLYAVASNMVNHDLPVVSQIENITIVKHFPIISSCFYPAVQQISTKFYNKTLNISFHGIEENARKKTLKVLSSGNTCSPMGFFRKPQNQSQNSSFS